MKTNFSDKITIAIEFGLAIGGAAFSASKEYSKPTLNVSDYVLWVYLAVLFVFTASRRE